LEKTKQAGELESLKAVEDNLSFTPEEEQYLDLLLHLIKTIIRWHTILKHT